MGLLNKLLDDLEERQADLSGDRDKILEGLSPVREDDLRPDRRKPYLAVSLVGICLAIALGYHFGAFHGGTLPVEVRQTNSQSPAMAADAGTAFRSRRAALAANTKLPGAGHSTPMNADERMVFDVQLTEMGESQAGVAPERVSAAVAEQPVSRTAANDGAEAAAASESADQQSGAAEVAAAEAAEGVKPATADRQETAQRAQTVESAAGAENADSAGNPDAVASATDEESPDGVANADSPAGSFSRVEVTAQSLYEEGLTLNESGNKAAAIEQMARAVERDPGHIEARDRLAAWLVDRGDTGLAIEVLMAGLQMHPDQHDWAELAAHMLVERGDLDAAVKTLEMTRPAASRDPDYYAFLAALLQKLGRYEESVAHYRRVVQVRPDKGIWWMGLGISLERTEKFGDANAAYANALEDNSLSNELRRYINQRMTVVSGR